MTTAPIRISLLALARCRAAPAAAPSLSTLTTASSPSSSGPTHTNKRWYRGDSGEMEHNLSPKEQELLSVAQPRADAIYERHVRLPKLNEIPQQSLDTTKALDDKEELELDVRRKRLIYRAKQRGWLEVDLLLGTWASQNVPNLNMDELDQFEAFVNLETIDIYNVITLRSDIPEEMKRNNGAGVVERIQDWVRASPLGKANPVKYVSVKHDNNLI